MTVSHSENMLNREYLASIALDSFRDGLSRRESLALSPVSHKLNEIIMSDISLDESSIGDMENLGVWRYVYGALDALGVGFIDKLFDFLKIQQKEINRVQTRLDLLKYKQSITGSLTASEKEELASLEGTAINTNEAINQSPDVLDMTTDISEGSQKDPIMSKHSENNNVNTTINKGDDPSSSTFTPAAAGSAAIATTAYATQRTIEAATGGPSIKLEYSLDAKYIAQYTDDTICTLEYRMQDSNFTARQKKTIQKTINHLRDAKESSAHIDDIKLWKQLADRNLLPIKTFEGLNLSTKQLRIFSTLGEDKDLIQKLANATQSDEIKSLLTSHGISHANDDILGLFVKASSPEDVSAITRVIGNSKHINRMAKFTRAIPFLDAGAAGLDIWVYLESSREAELIKQTNAIRGSNKQHYANFSLALGMADAAIGIGSSIALGLSAAGPVGWIGLGAAAVGYGIQQTTEVAYFDIRDQYMQNTIDYIDQYHSELKHAILQATMRGDKTIEQSSLENIGDAIEDLRNSGIIFGAAGLVLGMPKNLQTQDVDTFVPKTLEDAYRILFAIEELQKDNQTITSYKNYLILESQITRTDKEEQQFRELSSVFDSINQRVQHRLTYIRQYLPHASGGEYDHLQNALKSGNKSGVAILDSIIHDSHIYSTMQLDQREGLAGHETISSYLDAYSLMLEQKDRKLFTKLHDAYTTSPRDFVFFVRGIEQWKRDASNGAPSDLVDRADYILDFWDFHILQHPKDLLYPGPSSYNYVRGDLILENIYKTDILIHPAHRSLEDAQLRLSGYDYQDRSSIEKSVSSSLSQNILYAIARELHHYTGENNILQLIEFFSEEKGKTLGIYYDNGRYCNTEWALDPSLDTSNRDTMSGDAIKNSIISNVEIDTKTNAPDTLLSEDYRESLKNIIDREANYHTPKKKESIEQKILAYAQQAPGSYILLPDTLVIDGIKSGIGNLAHCYIMYDQPSGTLSFLDNDPDLNISISSYPFEQLKAAPLRESLTEYEEAVIRSIDSQVSSFQDMRKQSATFSHEDALDMPIEMEREFTRMTHEWDKTKRLLRSYSTHHARQILMNAQKSYGRTLHNLSIGILYNIDMSYVSNDQETGELLTAMSRNRISDTIMPFEEGSTSLLVLQDGRVSLNTKGHNFDSALVRQFGELIKKPIYQNKTIDELLADGATHSIGVMGAHLLLQVCLESGAVDWNNNQDITKIFRGTAHGQYASTSKVYSRRSYLLNQQYVSNDLYEDVFLDDNFDSPSKISENIQEVKQTINEVKHTLVDTIYDIDRGSQRGTVRYDPTSETLHSRGYSTGLTSIDGKRIISGLGRSYSTAEEAIYTANLINKIKKYKVDHPNATFSYKSGYRGGGNPLYEGGIYNVTPGDWSMSEQILTPKMIHTHFPTLLEKKDLFVSYLNTLNPHKM